MISQCHCLETHELDETTFDNLDNYKDRVRFLGEEDGQYQMKVDKNWRTLAKEESSVKAIYVITPLGIVTPEHILVEDPIGAVEQRRRPRGKQPPKEHRQPDATGDRGLPDVSTEDSMENIEINGRVLSRTRPNMELRELLKKLVHANEKYRAGLLRLLHE